MDWQIFWTVLGGAFGGALIGALATILVTRMNHKHEHKKWLQQKKLEAYTYFSSVTYGFLAKISRTIDISDHYSEMYAALGRLRLLANDNFSERARLILNSLFSLARLKKSSDPAYGEKRREVQKKLASLHTDLKEDLSKKD